MNGNKSISRRELHKARKRHLKGVFFESPFCYPVSVVPVVKNALWHDTTKCYAVIVEGD